jgi:hypothetical protein
MAIVFATTRDGEKWWRQLKNKNKTKKKPGIFLGAPFLANVSRRGAFSEPTPAR